MLGKARWFLVLAALCAALAAPLAATPLKLRLDFPEEARAGLAEPLRGLLRVEDAGTGQELVERQIELSEGGGEAVAAVVDLPRGSWKILLSFPGLWSEPVYVYSPGTDRERSLTARLWPVGTLEARFEVAAQQRMPAAVEVRFEDASDVVRERGVPEARATCEVGDGVWRCPVPAAKLDLRLRAEGFVSHYRWGVEVRPGETTALGELQLVPGASLVGHVEPQAGLDLSTVVVELRPTAAGARFGAEREQLERLALDERVDEQGFFHFRGVQPATYTLEARAPGWSPARLTAVQIVERAESELAAPIVLSRPLDLTVHVAPPADFEGRPWQVGLLSEGKLPNNLSVAAQGSVGPEGRFTGRGLSPGRFFVQVAASDGSTVTLREHVLESEEDRDVYVDLDLIEVRGSVELGGDPLYCEISFTREADGADVALVTDELGRFEGVLPEEGDWQVRIRAEEPPVERLLPRVPVHRPPGVRQATVRLEIDDREIVGEVVDADGEPVEDAAVRLLELDTVEGAHRQSDEEGEFRFAGVAAGRYLLQASTDDSASDQVDLELPKGEKTARTRLVLRRSRSLEGTVVGPEGPVPGAHVQAAVYRAGDGRPLSPLLTATSTAEGRFELRLPAEAGTVDWVVMSPGYGLLLERLNPVQSPVQLRIEPLAGTLVLTPPEPIDWAAQASPKPALFRDGVAIGGYALLQWAQLHGEPNRDPERFIVPGLSPGTYALCWEAVSAETFLAAPRVTDRCQRIEVHPWSVTPVSSPATSATPPP